MATSTAVVKRKKVRDGLGFTGLCGVVVGGENTMDEDSMYQVLWF